MSQNIQTNSVKFPVDLQIGVPQNGNPVRLKPLITHPVALGSFALKMLRTVQLNHRLFRRDKEIDDIPAKHFLPVDRQRKILQKIIPKMPFLSGHVLSQNL